ncbi:MAG: hypothetical protein ACLUPV_01495 [Bilophila wadsworthia]
MSSTIFTATSGTSISVDPHADVEGAGQQNPAVPHDAQNGAPAPGNPPNEDLVQAEARLRQMLDTALDRSGGLRGIGGDLYDAIKTEIPRPKVFHGGFRIHSAMLKAANACDVAAANLRRIPIADFHANPLPDAAFAALEAFVGAQNELYTQIGAFQKASGVSAALLDSLAQATQFRASEALNFAATMQLAAMPAERRQQIAPGVADPQAPTAGKAMQDMAHFMHGSGDVAGAFRADAARLSGASTRWKAARADAAGRIPGYGHPVARRSRSPARPHRRGDTPQRRSRGRPRPHPRPHPVRPRRGHARPFRRAAGRPCLRRSQSGRQIRRARDPAARGPVPVSLGLGPARRPRHAARHGARPLQRQGQRNHDPPRCRGALAERLAHEMEDAVRILRTPETRRACGTLLTMMAIAEHPTIGAKEIGGYYQHFCGERIPRGMADLLRRSVGQNGFVLVPSEMKRLAAQIENTPLLARWDPRFRVSGGRRDAALDRGQPAGEGEYIQAALDHHVDMNTILEASLRGIMADQLELRAGDAILTDTRKLGQGAANTVHLCTYRGRDGEDMKLVFKPEVGARRGLDHLCASGLGYRNGARVMQLNVAASRVADAIGCGGTIARSSIGSHDGQLGLFMEAAPGKTFFDIARGKPVCRMPDGKELNFPETCRVLRSNGKLDAMRANLMRELSKMEWADVLSGQVDRHGDNYLIDINPQTGAVKITGIDNDASFGTRKAGMTVVDLSRPTPRQQDFLSKLRREGYTIPPDGRIDLSKLPDRLLSETRQQFGFNQLFRPVFIDRDTFDKLTAIREDDYRAMLAPCMDNEAVDAAVSRLKDAQRHAARLEREHRVVEDWAAPGIKETYARHKVGAKGSFGERIQNGFFTRDFLTKFSAIL